MFQQRKRQYKKIIRNTNLTQVEKVETLNNLESGDKVVDVANEFWVGRDTVHDKWKNNEKTNIHYKGKRKRNLYFDVKMISRKRF